MNKMVVLAVACSLACSVSGETLEEKTSADVFCSSSGVNLPYREYVSKNVGNGNKAALVFFLHGAGERGNDNRAQIRLGVGSIIDYAERNGIPLILIAPQCSAGKKWVDTDWGVREHDFSEKPSEMMGAATELLLGKIKSLPVDSNRIYVTGLSMGGYGTWDMAMRRPDMFAAAIPVCGGADTAEAKRLAGLPLWVFHGGADNVVPVDCSRDMVKAVRDCGGSVKYTEFPGIGHDSWTGAYSAAETLDWMFSQRR